MADADINETVRSVAALLAMAPPIHPAFARPNAHCAFLPIAVAKSIDLALGFALGMADDRPGAPESGGRGRAAVAAHMLLPLQALAVVDGDGSLLRAMAAHLAAFADLVDAERLEDLGDG